MIFPWVFLVVFFLSLLSLAFLKVPDWPFCVAIDLFLQYSVLQDSFSFSAETSAAQINYICLVSIAFTFYPSSYASLKLETSFPTVFWEQGKKNTWKVYQTKGQKYPKKQRKEYRQGGNGEMDGLRSQHKVQEHKRCYSDPFLQGSQFEQPCKVTVPVVAVHSRFQLPEFS